MLQTTLHGAVGSGPAPPDVARAALRFAGSDSVSVLVLIVDPSTRGVARGLRGVIPMHRILRDQ
nr:hypothetical protein GCM10017745_28040 [Saccharothrix mutabilis subsp. capreolus]